MISALILLIAKNKKKKEERGNLREICGNKKVTTPEVTLPCYHETAVSQRLSISFLKSSAEPGLEVTLAKMRRRMLERYCTDVTGTNDTTSLGSMPSLNKRQT